MQTLANRRNKYLAAISWVALTAAIFLAILIIAFDKGQSAGSISGAGDIWWMDVPEIEQSYQKITTEYN